MTKDDLPPVVSLADAAKFLKLSDTRIYQFVAKGRLKTKKIYVEKRAVTRAELLKFASQLRNHKGGRGNKIICGLLLAFTLHTFTTEAKADVLSYEPTPKNAHCAKLGSLLLSLWRRGRAYFSRRLGGRLDVSGSGNSSCAAGFGATA